MITGDCFFKECWFVILESGSAICTYFLLGTCSKGMSCPFRHVRGERLVVCKHWLRGLCKKGDNCEFLHEYDMTKMPECYFYSRFGKISYMMLCDLVACLVSTDTIIHRHGWVLSQFGLELKSNIFNCLTFYGCKVKEILKICIDMKCLQ